MLRRTWHFSDILAVRKEGTYMDACMYSIARSVYQHRWALVIAWGVITLFSTPPALYLVLRKTAAWPQEKDSTWYEPNKWMVASSRNGYIYIYIHKFLICMAEIPVVPVILFYEKVSALEKNTWNRGVMMGWSLFSDWGCFSYYLQAFLIHPKISGMWLAHPPRLGSRSLFICPWLVVLVKPPPNLPPKSQQRLRKIPSFPRFRLLAGRNSSLGKCWRFHGGQQTRGFTIFSSHGSSVALVNCMGKSNQPKRPLISETLQSAYQIGMVPQCQGVDECQYVLFWGFKHLHTVDGSEIRPSRWGWLVSSNHVQSFKNISGGCFGFLPSTVGLKNDGFLLTSISWQFWWIPGWGWHGQNAACENPICSCDASLGLAISKCFNKANGNGRGAKHQEIERWILDVYLYIAWIDHHFPS